MKVKRGQKRENHFSTWCSFQWKFERVKTFSENRWGKSEYFKICNAPAAALPTSGWSHQGRHSLRSQKVPPDVIPRRHIRQHAKSATSESALFPEPDRLAPTLRPAAAPARTGQEDSPYQLEDMLTRRYPPHITRRFFSFLHSAFTPSPACHSLAQPPLLDAHPIHL